MSFYHTYPEINIGSGGHIIENSSGTAMTERSNLQFVGATVTDDSTNDRTIVTVDSGVSAELSNALTTSIGIGGISANTTYAKDTHIETILNDLLKPTLYPEFTDPSVTLTATGDKLIEKGGSLSTIFIATFDRGTINPAYGTNGYRAGSATGYSLNGGISQQGNAWNETVTESQTTYQASVAYAAGDQPKDSSGANYSSPLAAGSIDSNIITYEFVDAIWANSADITTVAKLSLVSKSAQQLDITFPAQTVTNPEIFDIPASWTILAIQTKDLSGQYEDASSQFTVTNTTHNNAGGTSTAYKRYTFNMGIATGQRTIRIKWS